jgi:hypothetical protein
MRSRSVDRDRDRDRDGYDVYLNGSEQTTFLNHKHVWGLDPCGECECNYVPGPSLRLVDEAALCDVT